MNAAFRDRAGIPWLKSTGSMAFFNLPGRPHVPASHANTRNAWASRPTMAWHGTCFLTRRDAPCRHGCRTSPFPNGWGASPGSAWQTPMHAPGGPSRRPTVPTPLPRLAGRIPKRYPPLAAPHPSHPPDGAAATGLSNRWISSHTTPAPLFPGRLAKKVYFPPKIKTDPKVSSRYYNSRMAPEPPRPAPYGKHLPRLRIL